MSPMLQAAQVLRETAEQLEGLATEPTVPSIVASIPEALTRLRLVNPKGYVSIDPPSFNWHTSRDTVAVGEWSVYDGKNHFRGPTLHAALTSCEAAHAVPEADPLAATMKLITGETVDLAPPIDGSETDTPDLALKVPALAAG